MNSWLLEDIWLGGRESPQYGIPSMGEVFEPPSNMVNQSWLKMYSFIFAHFKKENIRDYTIHKDRKWGPLNQSVENLIELIVQLEAEYSRYNLLYLDRVEEIQVM